MVAELKPPKRLPVYRGRLDKNILRGVTMRQNGEGPAVVLMDHDTREQRRTYRVSGRARALLIEAHGAEHIPGRHLTGVIVTRQTSGIRSKLRA